MLMVISQTKCCQKLVVQLLYPQTFRKQIHGSYSNLVIVLVCPQCGANDNEVGLPRPRRVPPHRPRRVPHQAPRHVPPHG